MLNRTSIARASLALFFSVQVVMLLPGSNALRAEDAKPAEPPKPKWESVASVDLTLTRGNSRSFLASTTINTQKKWAMDEVLLGGSAGYGNATTKSSSGVETTSETQDFLRGFGQYNHLFSERFYAGLRLEGLHDNVADINYRFTVSPLAGIALSRGTRFP